MVAHVDHGKTTLVDELLRSARRSALPSSASPHSCDADEGGEEEADVNGDVGNGPSSRLVMDSGELEIERGITITSKVTRLDYYRPSPSSSPSSSRTIVNVVDTPGHADFSGEVDRILSTVDGVCLVVDAAEGPMAQTKYVLSRALKAGLTPVVVLNKSDRTEGIERIESGETECEILDLFDVLGATDEQMEYATLYASAKDGWVVDDPDDAVRIADSGDRRKGSSMVKLLDAFLERIPEPSVRLHSANDDAIVEDGQEENASPKSLPPEAFLNDKFSMAVTTVGRDRYLGRICTGRIYSGSVGPNDAVSVLRRDAANSNNSGASSVALPSSNLTGLFVNRGADRTPLIDPPIAIAGDVVTLAGVPDSVNVGDTVTESSNPIETPIDAPPLAPPTLSVDFGPNDGPLAGKEGSIVTSSRIRTRLVDETDNNVTVGIERSEVDAEKTVVYGRGELQIGILVEQMRREGYELIVSPPTIVTKLCPDTGKTLEPYEEVIVDVDAEHAGTVVNALTGRRRGGVLLEMSDGSSSSSKSSSDGKTRLTFEVPSRGLLGFGPEIAASTRGTAVVNHCYLEDRERRMIGNIGSESEKGKLVSNESGKATLFALENLSRRGTLFVGPGETVYPGMVIGENNKSGDLEVNPVKAKATSNMRTQSKDEKLYLAPPKKMTVEELIGYMNDDEVVEVTPKSVRLRKAELDSGKRERAARTKKKRLDALRDAVKGGGGGGKKR